MQYIFNILFICNMAYLQLLSFHQVLFSLPEALDGALPTDRALGLMLHLLSNGDPMQNSQPHHGLGL